jgi:hypothetical protein
LFIGKFMSNITHSKLSTKENFAGIAVEVHHGFVTRYITARDLHMQSAWWILIAHCPVYFDSKWSIYDHENVLVEISIDIIYDAAQVIRVLTIQK